jgi:hypothetical protein
VGAEYAKEREALFAKKALESLCSNKRIVVLGHDSRTPRLPIFSFLIRHNERCVGLCGPLRVCLHVAMIAPQAGSPVVGVVEACTGACEMLGWTSEAHRPPFSAQRTRSFLHYNFVCALLNDLFGIQTRGG